MSNGEIILYTTEDGRTSIQLRAQEGTIWLTRTEIANLFQITPQNVTMHVRDIYNGGEAEDMALLEALQLLSPDGEKMK